MLVRREPDCLTSRAKKQNLSGHGALKVVEDGHVEGIDSSAFPNAAF